MIRVFIGYDEPQKVAYHTLAESIRALSSEPLAITPVSLSNLRKVFWRERQPNQSTDFAFSRFLVPYLSNYEGWSIFMDSDMLLRADIAGLWRLRDDRYSVMVCKHDYQTRRMVKFSSALNEDYTKKNWSSLMLLNNKGCTALTPEYVNTATGLELHQFKWLESESLIGELPLEWNWLVGEYDYNPDARIVHYTLGGPYFRDFEDCEYAGEWFNTYQRMKETGL